MVRLRDAVAAGAFALCLLGLLVAAGIGGVSADGASDAPAAHVAPSDGDVSEEAYVEAVPEEGDAYFEAEADDGSWISYINPRDEYRMPYHGDGSGKICVTLLNEAGEPIVGESVPETTVTVPTGEELEWHSHADPMTVEYPLTDNYNRPLDADQFGTNPDLPQGDGYLDSHCIEMHGIDENATVEYGEARIDGEHADRIELVGYVQQAHDAWDTDVDPIEDAEPYEEAGGWTYHPDGSHGQAVVVLQLEGEVEPDDSTDDGERDAHSDEIDSDDSTAVEGSETGTNESGGDSADRTVGFGALVAALALAAVALSRAAFGRTR
ncbi:PGF-CTERM sorting domain-containing protein [Natrarchaeobius oligotrophus]|uniref:PGF-CTERM sorting domain-containing protein n=1 Tax=Natrarchaeobius chitinivorans TaxID=1679083 RepID=A0A3N6NIP8_NATCH|nr:PGF-CTERM sorting domain-containing protein [Natrarchaeobius chitinivorans]RQG99022.1 PGF-CTERM sorting domain-containing protein [Natrarchaeobius chitinivorans]